MDHEWADIGQSGIEEPTSTSKGNAARVNQNKKIGENQT
jgi:hypothetical protein